MRNHYTRRGFTLIELLVVIVIIGVLTAVAVPQYQKAVAKSRFATLKSAAKMVKDAQEVFYYEHGDYGSLAELDVRTPASVTLSLSDTPELLYVRAIKNPNRYVLYFNHSKNFAGNSYCEAEQNNAVAKSVCEAEQGQDTGRVQNGYKLYLISGNSTGSFPYKYVSGSIGSGGATYFDGMDTYKFQLQGTYINVYKNGTWQGGWKVPNSDLAAYSFTNNICRSYPFLKECK